MLAYLESSSISDGKAKQRAQEIANNLRDSVKGARQNRTKTSNRSQIKSGKVFITSIYERKNGCPLAIP